MIATSSNLKEAREKFHKNKSNIAELLRLKNNQEEPKNQTHKFNKISIYYITQ